jgi:hypothetical protein
MTAALSTASRVTTCPRVLSLPNLSVAHRFNSSRADEVQVMPGRVTKTLRVLDMDVVERILSELKSVDTNSDER